MATYQLYGSLGAGGSYVTIDGEVITDLPYTLTKSCVINWYAGNGDTAGYYVYVDGFMKDNSVLNITDKDIILSGGDSTDGPPGAVHIMTINFTLTNPDPVQIPGIVYKHQLVNIADSVRALNGTTDLINIDEIPTKINETLQKKASGTLSISTNGTKDVINYEKVNVNIPNQNPYIVATPDLMGSFLNSNYEDCYVKYVGTDEEIYEKNAVYQVYQYTQGNFDFREVVWTGDSDATASDIASGKTAYVNGKKITGINTNDSSYSALLLETYPNAYSITYNLTGITASSSNPESISENSGALLTFTPNTGYALPDSVIITNVTSYNWNKGTGKLAISKPTGDVVITMVGVEVASFTQVYPEKSGEYTLLSNMDSSKIYGAHATGYGYFKYENSSWEYYDIEGYGLSVQSSTATSVTFRDTHNGDAYYVGVGPIVMIEGDTIPTTNDFAGLESDNVLAQWQCFVEGTLITMADGTQKKVEDLTYEDKVLTYNFDNSEMTEGNIFWIAKENVTPYYYKITLSDGTILKLVGANGKSHRLFSVDNQKFMYPQDFEGKVFKEDYTLPTIISYEKVYEEVKYYNFMNTHLNCFANNIMTGNRFSNIYPIENMKYVKNEIRNNDLTEFENIPQKYIDRLRLKEQKLEIDKNNVNYYDSVKEHITNLYIKNER